MYKQSSISVALFKDRMKENTLFWACREDRGSEEIRMVMQIYTGKKRKEED